MDDSGNITHLLDAARGGDRGALDQVLATLYQELHTMARRQLAGQHGQTLDATALVHEAYLKLAGRREAKFDDRAHFFAYAASAMRSVVVDYARQRLAQKRGGNLHRVTDLPEDLEGGLRLDEEMLGLLATRAGDRTITRHMACSRSIIAPSMALRLAGRTEALILDPVYTAKALSALIDQVRQGAIGPDETVVFVHTGGQPITYAYADEIMASL